MLDYDGLNDVLLQAQAGIRLAECHGFLCGQICVSGAGIPDVWHDYLLTGIEDEQQLQACLDVFREIASTIESQVDSPDLEFQLLLPDNQTIDERSFALAEWCNGFLDGLGTSGVGQVGKIPEECNEIISDIARIAKVSNEANDNEENEWAWMELTEYIRMGVLMLYQVLPKMDDATENVPPGDMH